MLSDIIKSLKLQPGTVFVFGGMAGVMNRWESWNCPSVCKLVMDSQPNAHQALDRLQLLFKDRKSRLDEQRSPGIERHLETG